MRRGWRRLHQLHSDWIGVRRRGVPVIRRYASLALLTMSAAGCGGRVELPATGGADASIADGEVVRDALSDSTAFDSPSNNDGGDSSLPAGDANEAGDTSDAALSSCGPTTCSQGCCSADGTCVTVGGAINACGSAGEPCETCPPGDFCKGSCVHFQANCGPSNCAGCCIGDGDCSTGVSDYACGQGGQQCQSCIPKSGTGQCVPQDAGGGGLCNGVISCNAMNCSGCCAGDTCMTGTSNDQCGTGGTPCQSCGTLQCGLVNLGGMAGGWHCVDAGACGPESCPGCCYEEGCAYGDQDTACGAGGATCQDCSLDGQTCVAHSCQ
jgi:hypothetical protein